MFQVILDVVDVFAEREVVKRNLLVRFILLPVNVLGKVFFNYLLLVGFDVQGSLFGFIVLSGDL